MSLSLSLPLSRCLYFTWMARCTRAFCTIRPTPVYFMLCLLLLQSFHSRSKNDKARVLHTHTHSESERGREARCRMRQYACAFVVTEHTNRREFLSFSMPSPCSCSRYWMQLVSPLLKLFRSHSTNHPLSIYCIAGKCIVLVWIEIGKHNGNALHVIPFTLKITFSNWLFYP